MQPKILDKVSSPPKSSLARVEDGKIRKLKPQPKPETTAVQHINGKTYACESCKRGHRVHKCDHGKTRPISETNQPGRPSGGQKRGCQCPRNCACTSKTCKCERDCSCTQEMFVIVRVEAPQQQISRDSTSTPKPVWEDANGNKMTLKKVWADANGKQIDEEEYLERKRKLKKREEGIVTTPASLPTPEIKSCCAAKQPKEEPESPPPPSSTSSAATTNTTTAVPLSGCRHRQNVPQTVDPVQPSTKSTNDPWTSACTCGSGCSCLYCPEHPNNATSINHTQQQVKNFAEHAYASQDFSQIAQFMPQSDSRSCMGGRQTFFLSRTPNVSQQQLQQFFSDTDPNAIYLTYPIQQHSWTNQPVSAHCSHSHSPSASMSITPESTEPTYIDPTTDFSTNPIPWELLPDDSNGIWNFSDGQLGDNGFSWMDFDASRGTDYHIGQATVASMSNPMSLQVPQPSPGPLLQATGVDFDSMLQTAIGMENANVIHTPMPQYNTTSSYMAYQPSSINGTPNQGVHPQSLTMNMPQMHQPSFNFPPATSFTQIPAYQPQPQQPMVRSCCGGGNNNINTTTALAWPGIDPFDESPSDLRSSISIPNSPPILNGA